MMLSPLPASAGPDEIVQAREQIADLGFATDQRRAEVVDDVADLAESAAVDDRRQRRQRLLGRADRSTTGSAQWSRPAADARGRLARPADSSARCIEPSRAGLTDRRPPRWRGPRRRVSPRSRRRRASRAPSSCRRCRRRRRRSCTGEFDSSVADIRDLDVIDLRIGSVVPTAPGSGSEFNPWKAQPVAVEHDTATEREQAPCAVRMAIMITGVPSAGSGWPGAGSPVAAPSAGSSMPGSRVSGHRGRDLGQAGTGWPSTGRPPERRAATAVTAEPAGRWGLATRRGLGGPPHAGGGGTSPDPVYADTAGSGSGGCTVPAPPGASSGSV